MAIWQALQRNSISVRPASSAENSTSATKFLRQLDHRADGFQRLLARHVQLGLQVQVRGSQKNVHAWIFRRLQRLGRRHNVVFASASQRRDGHFLHFLAQLR